MHEGERERESVYVCVCASLCCLQFYRAFVHKDSRAELIAQENSLKAFLFFIWVQLLNMVLLFVFFLNVFALLFILYFVSWIVTCILLYQAYFLLVVLGYIISLLHSFTIETA